MEQISFEVLGALRVTDAAGTDVTPRGTLQRRLLATLLLHRGKVVSVDTLTEVLWPDQPSSGSAASLQSHVFRLRQHVPGLVIDPGRRAT